MAIVLVVISVISAMGFESPIAAFRTSPDALSPRHTAGLQGVDSVLHDAAPSLLGPSFRGSRPRFLVKRWPAGPSSQEAHGLVVEAVHGILTEFDIYLSLIQKLLEGGVRVSWATVCGAYW